MCCHANWPMAGSHAETYRFAGGPESNRLPTAVTSSGPDSGLEESGPLMAPPKYHIEHPMPGPIPARPADTALDAECAQAALFRAAPVARRLHLALALSATTIGAARRALARARPHASTRDLDLWFVELHYGADVAAGLRADLDRRDTTPRPGA